MNTFSEVNTPTFIPKAINPTFIQNKRNISFIYILSPDFVLLSITFPATKERKHNPRKLNEERRKKERKGKTLMLFTAGLFKRLRCFWTSSCCLDVAVNLASQQREINKQKSTARALLDLPLLNWAKPILVNPTKSKTQQPKIKDPTAQNQSTALYLSISLSHSQSHTTQTQ